MGKSADAFRTISEVADWLEVPAHVLRFWESKFTQVKPVKRAGGRRYYRPADMRLLGGIKVLLHDEGLTIKGVQKMLREEGVSHVAALSPDIGKDDAAPVPASPAAAQVLSFARPDTPPDTAARETSEATATPEPDATAEPEPEHQPAPEPEATPAPAPVPAPLETTPEPAAPALPSLPDLPLDPPDDAPAAPGPLARLAALPRPLPEGLVATLSALAERLREADAPKR
jgi:DNA-binding transcriptional MerR regulator